LEGSPEYGNEGMEDDMMGDMDDYGQEGEHYEEGDPMDGSQQYGEEGAEYGDENVSYKNIQTVLTVKR
jgi:hypothetical protein